MFLIGAAFDVRWPDEFDAAELELIASQFNALTPKNSMKPGPIRPQEDRWHWTQADALVEFGLARDMRLFGHTLVWHAQTSPWFFEGATRDLALARLRTHILTLVGRYKGRLAGWDIVNEAIADGGDARHGDDRASAHLAVAADRRAGQPAADGSPAGDAAERSQRPAGHLLRA